MRAYERGGAAALSILTEGDALRRLDRRPARRARRHGPADPAQGLHRRPLPALRGGGCAGGRGAADRRGARAPRSSSDLHAEAAELDLDCLVEVHDAEELEAALETRRRRDRHQQPRPDATSRSTCTRTFELLADVPAGKTVVSESGIRTREQIEELEQVGVDAVLVGEILMRSDDPEAACRDLAGAEESSRLPEPDRPIQARGHAASKSLTARTELNDHIPSPTASFPSASPSAARNPFVAGAARRSRRAVGGVIAVAAGLDRQEEKTTSSRAPSGLRRRPQSEGEGLDGQRDLQARRAGRRVHPRRGRRSRPSRRSGFRRSSAARRPGRAS